MDDGWMSSHLYGDVAEVLLFYQCSELQILSVFNDNVLDKQLQLNKLTCEVII